MGVRQPFFILISAKHIKSHVTRNAVSRHLLPVTLQPSFSSATVTTVKSETNVIRIAVVRTCSDILKFGTWATKSSYKQGKHLCWKGGKNKPCPR